MACSPESAATIIDNRASRARAKAAVSMILRSRAIASAWLSSSKRVALRIRPRIGRIDAVDLRRLDHEVAGQFGRPQHGRRVRGEIGIARAAAEHDDAPSAEMIARLLARIGFADRWRRHRRLGSRRKAQGFERAFERERIHEGRQHADRIAARAIDPLLQPFDASEEVSTADDHRDLMAARVHGAEVARDARHRRRIEAERPLPRQGLARELDQNARCFLGMSAVRPSRFACRATLDVSRPACAKDEVPWQGVELRRADERLENSLRALLALSPAPARV